MVSSVEKSTDCTVTSLHDARGNSDLILEFAQWLPQDQRILLETVLRDGLYPTELATLSEIGQDPVDGRHRKVARSVSLEVRRLSARLMAPRFAFILENLKHWCPMRQRIAKLCFIEGRSQRYASRFMQLSLHKVRGHYHAILALCDAAHIPHVAPIPTHTPPHTSDHAPDHPATTN